LIQVICASQKNAAGGRGPAADFVGVLPESAKEGRLCEATAIAPFISSPSSVDNNAKILSP
jgi:hypothetical protein